MILHQIVLLITILYTVSGILGFLFLKLIKIDSMLPATFMVSLPLYIIMGFSLLLSILTILGLLTIGPSTFLFLVFLTILLVAFLLKKRRAHILINGRTSLTYIFKHCFLNTENIVPLILYVATFIFFIDKINRMQWPPVGDVLSLHGPLISLFLFNGRLTPTLQPLVPWILYYPPGFHVLAANIASWFNIFPGEAALLLGGSATILIFWLIYSLTYIYSNSKLLSTAVLLSPFVYHPSGHLSRWIIGFLYNGTYPSLVAILLSMFSITMLATIDKTEITLFNYPLRVTLVLLSIMFTLLVEYPPYLPLILIELIYLVLKYRGTYHKYASSLLKNDAYFLTKNNKKITIILVILLVTSICLINDYCGISDYLAILSSRFYTYYFLLPSSRATFLRKISFSYFYDHITGLAMMIAFVISLLFILAKKYTNLSFTYFICFILLLLSQLIHLY